MTQIMVADQYTHNDVKPLTGCYSDVTDLCKETVENNQIVTPEDDHSPL